VSGETGRVCCINLRLAVVAHGAGKIQSRGIFSQSDCLGYRLQVESSVLMNGILQSSVLRINRDHDIKTFLLNNSKLKS
jgi:hypothetical protein